MRDSALGLSGASFVLMVYFKYFYELTLRLPNKPFVETPLPLLVVRFFLAGVGSILMGVLAEMVMRTYYESQHKTTYLLGEVRQGNPDDRDGPPQ